MITKITKLFTKKKPTFFEKAKSTATSYGSTAKAKGMDAMGKIQKSKIYTEASKSVSELKSNPKAFFGKINDKAYKHVTKNPKKYIAGATAVAGVGVYSQHQKRKKDGTHARLKKELKRKGYV